MVANRESSNVKKPRVWAYRDKNILVIYIIVEVLKLFITLK